jgi:hypothetical protein
MLARSMTVLVDIVKLIEWNGFILDSKNKMDLLCI